MQVLGVIGVAAGAEHGLERPAGSTAHLAEEEYLLFGTVVSSTATVVPPESANEAMSSALPKACSDSLCVPFRGRQT